jgi:hypothetical protein
MRCPFQQTVIFRPINVTTQKYNVNANAKVICISLNLCLQNANWPNDNFIRITFYGLEVCNLICMEALAIPNFCFERRSILLQLVLYQASSNNIACYMRGIESLIYV